MRRNRIFIFLILLLLTTGAALVLVKTRITLARTRESGYFGQSQGNHYTLSSTITKFDFDKQYKNWSSSPQQLHGGIYVLDTMQASKNSQHSPQGVNEVTGVITHTHSVNPGAFLYDEDSTDITMNIYYGLRWAANPNERGGFYMSRPADWDGQSPVTVRITFATGSGDAGTVNWRMRLNSYNPNSGEWLTNPASRDADEILVFVSGSSLRIFDQTFTLQPQDFSDEPYWSMYFTRGDGTNGETFAGNLYVMGVDVIYQATTGTEVLYLPIIAR